MRVSHRAGLVCLMASLAALVANLTVLMTVQNIPVVQPIPQVQFNPFVNEAQAADDDLPAKYATGYKPPSPEVRARTIKQTGHVTFPKVSAPAWDCVAMGIVPPVVDQANCGSCFMKGTLVRMADGSEKPIEDVRIGDVVVTAEGNTGTVYATMQRPVEEALLTLKTWGHRHLSATSNHPILTKRGYVFLRDVAPGDWVAFPKYSLGTSTSIKPTDIIGFERPRTGPKVRLPETIKLTSGFGRLIGLYLAEGSSDDGRRLRWTFNASERNTFAAEVVSLARSELGMEAFIETTRDYKPNTIYVTLCNSRLTPLFEELCGRGSAEKRLHPSLASGPDDFLGGVLAGWMDGDRHRKASGVSVSRHLALNMFDIANARGLMPAFQTHTKEKTDKNGVHHKRSWRVHLNDDSYQRGAAMQDATHMWRRVQEVTPTEVFTGDVYNLEVEGDHSYVAEGVGVHNCWDFAGSGTVTCAMLKAGALMPDGKTPAKADGSFRICEQYVLDCGRNGGCNGDDHSSVFDMAKGKGLPIAAEYGAYQARAGKCKDTSGMKMYTINAWGYCDPGARGAADTQKIKDAMVQYGPISVAIAANNAFSNVKPGEVFKGNASGINHEVILVGWDDAKGAWRLRNSWSNTWCDGGYCWIAYGANGVGTDAAWVSVTPVPPPPGPPTPPTPPVPPIPGAAPTITSALTATAQAGASFAYQIAATNAPTAYAASGLPAGLTVNTTTGAITGTPTATGAFSIGLIAANSSGAGTATLTLSVGTGPAPLPGAVSIQLSPDTARNIMVQIANQTGGVIVTPDMTLQDVIDAMAKVKKGEPQPKCCGGVEAQPASDDRIKAQQMEIDAIKRGMTELIKAQLKR